MTHIDYHQLAHDIKDWGAELGFQQTGISAADLGEDETHLLNWLAADRHGAMDYMQRHGLKRSRPADLQPGTLRVISVRMDYDPPQARDSWEVLRDPALGYISRYALGRDYHKVLRAPSCKSSPTASAQASARLVIAPSWIRRRSWKKALARNAGLGWIGKHTNLLNSRAGSWFFLGEASTPIWRCPSIPRRRRIVELVYVVSRSAPPRPSSHRTSSTRAGASLT